MTSFSQVTDQLRRDGGASEVHVSADWLQGRTAHGGLTAALCVEAAQRAAADLPPLRAAQFAFIGPASGALTVTPTTLRSGKSAVFVGVDLTGEAGIAVRALLCFGAGRASALSHRALPMPATPPPEDCPPYFDPARAPNFAVNFDCRLAAGARPMTAGAPPQMRVWVRHRDPDAGQGGAALVALADAIPPAAIILFPAPAPFSTATWSLELLTEDLACDSGWRLVETRADTAEGGYSSQAMTIWNEDGRPVIAARQSVAIFG